MALSWSESSTKKSKVGSTFSSRERPRMGGKASMSRPSARASRVSVPRRYSSVRRVLFADESEWAARKLDAARRTVRAGSPISSSASTMGDSRSERQSSACGCLATKSRTVWLPSATLTKGARKASALRMRAGSSKRRSGSALNSLAAGGRPS
eukprot:scaffold232417_cov32-Tisochrysis_lutea.AAC.1